MYAKLVLFWALAVQLAWSQTVSLSVREAMHLAARRLPSVQAAQALLEGAQAYAQSIGAQPNPYLRLSGVAGQPPEEANALVFRFDIAGQPQLRELSAQEEVKARKAELQAERRKVALQTGLAYAMLWERQKLLEVAGLKSELARQLERSSLRRFSVGEIARNAYLRAQLERARAEADEATAQAEFEQSLGLLNLLLGEKPERPLQLQTTLPDLAPPKELGVRQQECQALPEVIALSSEAAALQHQRALAAKANSPELQFQIYQSRFFAADPVQGVQLTLNIPLWDWGQVEAEVGRRQGQAKAAEARLAERKLALQQRVLEVSKRYQAAQARVKILASQAEHLAKLAQDASRAYDANLMSMLEVFDVQQSYRLALQGYITAQAELARSGLELGALEPGGFFEEVAREQDH